MDLPASSLATLGALVTAAEARLKRRLDPTRVEWVAAVPAKAAGALPPVQLIETDAELAALSLKRGSGAVNRTGCFAFFAAAPPPPAYADVVVSAPVPPAPAPPAVVATLAAPAESRPLVVVVNGKEVVVESPSPSMLLVDFLRGHCGLTGTKIGCGEGGCGACTVAIKPIDSEGPPVAVNSCLRLLCACDGYEVTTVEGVGSEASGFGECQTAIADGNGSQCGFCTPGWVVNMHTLLEENPAPTPEEVEQRFDGNICRCTGYRPILDAFQGLAQQRVIECRKDLNQCGDMEDIAGCDERKHYLKSGGAGGVGASGGCCKTKKPAAKPAKAGGCCKGLPAAAAGAGADVAFMERSSGDAYMRPSSLAGLRAVVAEAVAAEAATGQAWRLVCGNTGMGVAKYYAQGVVGQEWVALGQPPEGNATCIDVGTVGELTSVEALPWTGDHAGALVVGAGVTLAGLISSLTGHFGKAHPVYGGVVRHLRRVANTQVRGAGSWGGNLAMAAKYPEFVSDVAVVLAAIGVTLEVTSAAPAKLAAKQAKELRGAGPGSVSQSVAAFMDPATSALTGDAGAVLVRGTFPACADVPGVKEFVFFSDKTGQRHVNSHAIANCAVLFTLGHGSRPAPGAAAVVAPPVPDHLPDHSARCVTIEAVGCAVNGLVGRLLDASSALTVALEGRRVDREADLQRALGALDGAVAGAGGMAEDPQNSKLYRSQLARVFLYKAFLTAASGKGAGLPDDLASAAAPFAAAEDRPVSSGSQTFSVNEPSTAPVGQYVTKLSAKLQASGEAKFTSDLPHSSGEGVPDKALWGCFVLTTASQRMLLGVDAAAAYAMPGVVAVVDASDIPGKNVVAPGALFVPVGRPSPFVGAPVALAVADTLKRARAAAKAVVLSFGDPIEYGHPDYEGEGREVDLPAAMLEFAKGPLASRMKLRPPQPGSADGVTVTVGDVEAAFARNAGKVADGEITEVRGRVSLGGQKHFFLETHAALAVPDEDRRIVVTSGTQFGQLTQGFVADVLGRPLHRVEIKVRRIGGAYGGKITQGSWAACAAAVAAVKLNRPVAIHSERVDDMSMFGGREPIMATYRAQVTGPAGTDGSGTGAGTFAALDMFLAMDGGRNAPQALGSLSMATSWSDGCYFVPNFRSKGTVRFSARPDDTSCRAPGNLQSITLRELVNEHVAHACGLPLQAVQEANLYQPGDVTPFGDVIASESYNWTVPELWQQCKDAVGWEQQQADAAAFNGANRFRKRGVCMVPTKYGMGPSDYKVGALVNIYGADGSVEVHHSGAEMGQGINTKVAQAVAFALGCDLGRVVVADNSTATVPNGGCTGGSGTSESVVGAALLACAELNATLDPLRTPPGVRSDDDFEAAALKAMTSGNGLSATGWFNEAPATETGTFDYASQGVGFACVEVDCLTGEVQVLRMDLHMDLGSSLNPAVDIGQVEGGLVMALGYMLCEEVLYKTDARADRHGGGILQVNLGTWGYKPPSALDIPQVLNINLLPGEPNPSPAGVLGSKACGEPPMALAAAVALAVKAAVFACRLDLHGVSDYVQLDLPLTVERVQQACRAAEITSLRLR